MYEVQYWIGGANEDGEPAAGGLVVDDPENPTPHARTAAEVAWAHSTACIRRYGPGEIAVIDLDAQSVGLIGRVNVYELAAREVGALAARA